MCAVPGLSELSDLRDKRLDLLLALLKLALQDIDVGFKNWDLVLEIRVLRFLQPHLVPNLLVVLLKTLDDRNQVLLLGLLLEIGIQCLIKLILERSNLILELGMRLLEVADLGLLGDMLAFGELPCAAPHLEELLVLKAEIGDFVLTSVEQTLSGFQLLV